MFLTGTLLNVATVLLGTMVGLLLGSRMPERLHTSLTTALGLFTALFGSTWASASSPIPRRGQATTWPSLRRCWSAWRLGSCCDCMTASKRSAPGSSGACRANDRPSRIAEGFVTASLVFCVGPLTILGSIANGLTGNIELLAIKSALDGVASIAFAATLGAGVALSAVTVLIVQGGIAAAAFLLRGAMDETSILAITSAGGIMLVGVALRLLDLKAVRVASFLPALLLAPLFIRLAAAIR